MGYVDEFACDDGSDDDDDDDGLELAIVAKEELPGRAEQAFAQWCH